MNTVAESATEVISAESKGTDRSTSTLVQSEQQLRSCSNNSNSVSNFVPVNPVPMEYYSGANVPPPPPAPVQSGGNEAPLLLSTSPASA